MSLNVDDEKRELRSDSLIADEDDVLPPSYSVAPPREEAPEDLSARLARLDLSSTLQVSTSFFGVAAVATSSDFKRLMWSGRARAWRNEGFIRP